MLQNKYNVKIRKAMRKNFWPFHRAAPSEKKSSRFSTLMSYQSVGTPIWTSDYFEDQVHSGYQRNALVYRCVNLIARSISSVPLRLMDGQMEIKEHPLLSMIQQPNPLQTYPAFCESVIAYLLLSGNSFIEAVIPPGSQQPPIELYPLRPDRLSIIPDSKGFPKAYAYQMGSEKQQVAVDAVTGRCPILHIKFFNPLDHHKGMSPLMAARYVVDLQNTVIGHHLALLQNAGCPSGALIVKGARLTTAQHLELKEQIAKIKGRGAGNMLLLDGDFDWKEMGLSPRDLDFIEAKTLYSRDIAQIFGIPPMCVGILGDATYSNYQEARLHLWEDTLLPLLDLFLANMNHWLTPLFGENLKLSYHKDTIDALVPRREKLWERVEKMSCLTTNEKRTILGYPPLDGGDTLSGASL